MRVVRLVAVVVLCAAVTTPALAQESAWRAPLIASGAFQITAPGLRGAAGHAASDPVPAQRLFPAAPRLEPRRPDALVPLYGSLIALQGLDFHSTRRAIDSGSGREANPAMREVVNNGAAFLAVKAGATAGVIWASEKMWKKNRKGAVIFATVVNAAMAAIVASNYRVGR